MIGDLYNANNVVVGQAAVLVAPNNTPMPSPLTANVADPFDLTPWAEGVISGIAAPMTTFTLTVTRSAANGGAQTTAALPIASTATAVQTALQGLSNVGAGNVKVGGAAPTFTYSFVESLSDAVLTITPTGGGTPAITAGLWTPVGATDQGWSFGTNKSTTTIGIEEQSTPTGTTIASQAVTIDGALSEDISSTLALAYNATLARTAPGATAPGFDTLSMTDTVLQYAVAMLTANAQGLTRWIYAPSWTQLANVATAFRRASAKRMYPVSFGTVCKPSQIQIVNFTAAHT